MANTQVGKIKFWNSSKGFGFIKKENGGEIFVHATKLKDPDYTPGQDDEVEFVEGTNKRGAEAQEVTKIS